MQRRSYSRKPAPRRRRVAGRYHDARSIERPAPGPDADAPPVEIDVDPPATIEDTSRSNSGIVGLLRRLWRSRLQRSVAIATILSTGIAACALWVQTRAEQAQPRVEAFAVGRTVEIDSDALSPGKDSRPVESVEQTTVVDVTFLNPGGAAALITSLRLKVLAQFTLEECAPSGAGVQVTAKYDFVVPPGDIEPDGIYDKSVRFDVQPEQADRLQVTLGPGQLDYRDPPTVYAFELYAKYSGSDGHSRLGRGRIASPDSNADYYLEHLKDWTARYPECVAANAAGVELVSRYGGEASPTFMRLVAGNSADEPLGTDSDWSAVTDIIPCGPEGTAPAAGSPLMADDVTGDQVDDILLALECNSEQGYFRPDGIVLIDGLRDSGKLKVLGHLYSPDELRGVIGQQGYSEVGPDGSFNVTLVYGDQLSYDQVDASSDFAWVGQNVARVSGPTCYGRWGPDDGKVVSCAGKVNAG